MNRRSLHVLTLSLLAFHALGLALERGSGFAWTIGQGINAAAGLGILHLVPGIYLAALLFRGRAMGLGALGLAAVGLNFAYVIAISTALKLCGFTVTPWAYWAGTTLTAACLAVALELCRTDIDEAPHHPRPAWPLALGCVAIALYVLTAHRPIPWSEDDFLTPDFHCRLARLEPSDRDTVTPASASPYDVPGILYRGSAARTASGALVFRPGSREIQVAGARVLWLASATHECLLTFKRGDKLLSTHYFHPPFDITRHPRNYPPNTQLVDLSLPRGSAGTSVAVTVRSAQPQCELRFHDLTDIPLERLRAYVRKRFAIWDIGDVREQLSLARNLRDHLLPFSYSYDGTVFDSGGYTITHLPLRSYVGMAALALMGDRMSSFFVVWVGQLCVIFLLTYALARSHRVRPSGLAAACALLPVLAYATLVRPNVEGACLRTTSIIVLLGAAYWLFWRSDADGERKPVWPVILFGCLCVLTKLGVMALPALLFAHVSFTESGSKRVRVGLALAGGTLLGLAAVAVVVGKALGVWEAWWATFLGGSFLGKFSIAITALTGVQPSRDFVRLGQRPWGSFLHAIADLSWWTLLGSCFLPLAVCLRRDRQALVLLLAGAFGYAVVAISDPSLIVPNVYCSHYFTRVAGVVNLLAAGGLRCLCLQERHRRWHVIALVLGLAALPLAAMEHRRQDAALERYPWHRSMYKAAVIDSLKRRAATHIRLGRLREARDDCRKMRAVDETYLPTALLWAKCDQAEGRWDAAVEFYEVALRRPRELDSAREFIEGCLNAALCCVKLGRAERARYWLEQATGAKGFDAAGLAGQARAVRQGIAAMGSRQAVPKQ